MNLCFCYCYGIYFTALSVLWLANIAGELFQKQACLNWCSEMHSYYSFLDEVGTNCEAASEFLALYKKLFDKDHWKYYLAVKGVPVRIALLITKVCSTVENKIA